MELSLNEMSVYHRLCARGDQQVEGESVTLSDLYAPTVVLLSGRQKQDS